MESMQTKGGKTLYYEKREIEGHGLCQSPLVEAGSQDSAKIQIDTYFNKLK